jgi:16S rRNA (guanine527-N7)-methyltransferase
VRSREYPVDLPPFSLDGLSRFLAELDRWGRTMDLTGPLTADELCAHALESALGARLIPANAALLDIGSGAGFPGVPLAIARPDLIVSALEPRAKRVEFLRHAARAIPVGNLRVLHGRLDSVSPASWDVATARAIGQLEQTVGEAPFLRPGGALLVWTTEPEGLQSSLAPVFALERIEAIPASRRRAIALFRKRAVGSRQTPEREGVFPVERGG